MMGRQNKGLTGTEAVRDELALVKNAATVHVSSVSSCGITTITLRAEEDGRVVQGCGLDGSGGDSESGEDCNTHFDDERLV